MIECLPFPRFGHVGIYDEKFRLQRSYDIDIDTDPYADYDVAKSDPGWVCIEKYGMHRRYVTHVTLYIIDSYLVNSTGIQIFLGNSDFSKNKILFVTNIVPMYI